MRRFAAISPVRALLAQPPVTRIISIFLRSSVLRESPSFALRELLGRRVLREYRLRGSGLRVYIRHGTPDVATLDDVFYSRHYRLPEPVATLLSRLGRPPLVLDLGANIGLFGVFILERYPAARITAFEPDVFNAELLKRCIAANNARLWGIVEAAACAYDGTVAFSSGHFSLSRVEPDERAAEHSRVPALDVLPRLPDADLLKMDIEGGEWAILEDARFEAAAPDVVVLEYHPHLCPHPDPREAAGRLLRDSGFETQAGQEFAAGHGMLWAWRSQQAKDPALTRTD